ncbi:MAG TPA: TetR family transcriptional regulator C-terminal domain-containing protein [Burkholderiales bacterium]|nr:TetR family transcriptional regulator C-terminal domain-containing protein [Burkholderiales bacterium]
MTAETKFKSHDATREKLLSSAYCEIRRHGYQGASINNILESTGLTKGALYHHFATKHALGLAVIDEVIAVNLNDWFIARIRDSETPVETLLDVIAQLGSRLDEEAILLGCPLNNLIQEMSPLDEQFRHRLNVILEEWQSAIHTALLNGQRQGTIKPEIDCSAAALFILSAWEGCIGMAKNRQSVCPFQICLQQLQGYIRSLMIL